MLLLFAACSPSAPKSSSEPFAECTRGLEVGRSAIDFGEVALGARAGPETVTLRSTGTCPLEIRGLTIEDGPFSVSAVSSVLVEDEATFTVAFAPETPEAFAGEIRIETSDINVAIALVGSGVGGVLALPTSMFDFGMVNLGCPTSLPFVLPNSGNADLVVTALSLDDPAFSLIDAPELPLTLPPGRRAEFELRWEPAAEGLALGHLLVASTDAREGAGTVVLTGAAEGTFFTETFMVPDDGTVDLVVAIETSEDFLEAHGAKTLGNLDALRDALDDQDLDWQLGIVTSDDGCAKSDWIEGGGGAYAEMGFTLLDAAFSAENLAGCNADLVRDEATLAIVGITDGPERSRDSWSTFIAMVEGVKADAVVHAVAGDWPSGCSEAEAGAGWYEASVATGGMYLSICATDWASHLAEALGEEGETDSFELSNWPFPDTMTVTVDGVEQREGWLYNSTDRTVDFEDGHLPEPGSVVEVTYAVYGC